MVIRRWTMSSTISQPQRWQPCTKKKEVRVPNPRSTVITTSRDAQIVIRRWTNILNLFSLAWYNKSLVKMSHLWICHLSFVKRNNYNITLPNSWPVLEVRTQYRSVARFTLFLYKHHFYTHRQPDIWPKPKHHPSTILSITLLTHTNFVFWISCFS